jgi:branched-chain amino acid transport system substrate-binding protein
MTMKNSFIAALIVFSPLGWSCYAAHSQGKYDPGASDTEIKVGNIMAYSGRKLVESDEVLFLFGTLETPSNSAIQKYLNAKKVPQLFVATGASKWGNPKEFPWTIGWQPAYQSEGRIYAKYLLKEKPDAKIAVLYQNDDFGKDLLTGMRDGLGEKAPMIVAEDSYAVSEPTIESHIVKLKSTGANVFLSRRTRISAANEARDRNHNTSADQIRLQASLIR